MIKRRKIFVTGRIQGVGFRPAIYRIAHRLGLSGFVFNDTKGVTIELQGEERKIDEFMVCLESGALPVMAKIETCESIEIETLEAEGKFVINTSLSDGTVLSQVTAVCRRELPPKQVP